MTKLTLTGAQFADLLAHVHCMGGEGFKDAFGEMADHLWYKYHDYFKRDVGRFITYLDLHNLESLMQHFARYMKSLEVKRD